MLRNYCFERCTNPILDSFKRRDDLIVIDQLVHLWIEQSKRIDGKGGQRGCEVLKNALACSKQGKELDILLWQSVVFYSKQLRFGLLFHFDHVLLFWKTVCQHGKNSMKERFQGRRRI